MLLSVRALACEPLHGAMLTQAANALASLFPCTLQRTQRHTTIPDRHRVTESSEHRSVHEATEPEESDTVSVISANASEVSIASGVS